MLIYDVVGDFKKMRIKRRKGRESSSPREQKIECIYCDKSFSILKFTAHIATSGHRRNLALKKGTVEYMYNKFKIHTWLYMLITSILGLNKKIECRLSTVISHAEGHISKNYIRPSQRYSAEKNWVKISV